MSYARCTPYSWMIRMGAAALLLLVLVGPVAVGAQTGGGYDLSWWTADGGGQRLDGGRYLLLGTAGQPDACALSGGSYQLAGGFWLGGAAGYRLYLPITLKAK